MDLEEKRNVGRYSLFHSLASGGMATVYLGCLRSGAGVSRPVAIKKLHPHIARGGQALDRFLTEARIASRIRHPNVVAVLDVVAEGDDQLLVMEYVHGESVAQLVAAAARAGEPIPIDVAVRIMVDALEGLHAAHEAANEHGAALMVVHRDVSPQNIMVDAEGRARIVDFGIAKALERSFTTESSSEFRGKLAYAAPEQIAGGSVDRRTDLWSAGMVLWELLASRRYFGGADPAEIVRRITAEPLSPPSTARPCPAALDATVVRALERDPDLRFPSAREMALALENSGAVADHRTVGRWMRRLARARLDDKKRMVDEMEAELLRASLPVVLREADATGPTGVAKTEAPPRRRDGVRRAVVVLAIAAVGLGAAFVARRAPTRTAPSPVALVAMDGDIGISSTRETGAVAAPAAADAGAPEAPASVGVPVASARRRSRSTTRPAAGARAGSAISPEQAPPATDPLDMDERQ